MIRIWPKAEIEDSALTFHPPSPTAPLCFPHAFDMIPYLVWSHQKHIGIRQQAVQPWWQAINLLVLYRSLSPARRSFLTRLPGRPNPARRPTPPPTHPAWTMTDSHAIQHLPGQQDPAIHLHASMKQYSLLPAIYPTKPPDFHKRPSRGEQRLG